MNPRKPRPPRTSPPRLRDQNRFLLEKRRPVVPAKAGTQDKGERVQKLLAAAGLGSRREVERWIEAGRVSIGDRVAKLGDRARPGDSVFLDKKLIGLKARSDSPRVVAYHKPVGELVTRSDPQGRPTVFDRLPKLRAGRWIAIGRLDLNSSGLLLFTDCGELANRLMHPSQEIEREYAVRVQGGLGEAALRRLLAGVELDDGLARFRRIYAIQKRKDEGANRWYQVALAEGRNREVRRLVEAVGSRVSRLIRVRFGPVALPRELPPGRALELSPETVAKIARTGKSC